MVITLRYLASGDSQQSQSFNFRVGRSSVCKIIQETCTGIWNALSHTYLKAPKNSTDWKQISKEFYEEWNFPHCIGALDGKHIMIECPARGGSDFFNYKGFHSIVLLAPCDAKYCLTMVDIGSFGKDNDANIYNQSVIRKGFATGAFHIPESEIVHGHELAYVIVSDEIFALKTYLMKQYPGNALTESRRVFNYRLSRSRRVIENTFGILSARRRIFRRPINAKQFNVDNIVKDCVCLHNYLRLKENGQYVRQGSVDTEDNSGNIVPGHWRAIVEDDDGGMAHLRQRVNRYGRDAKETRIKFEEYFNSEEGSVPWQLKYVRSCGESFAHALYYKRKN